MRYPAAFAYIVECDWLVRHGVIPGLAPTVADLDYGTLEDCRMIMRAEVDVAKLQAATHA